MRTQVKARPLWLATIVAFAVSGCANPGGFQQLGGNANDSKGQGDLNIFESTFDNPDPCANSNRNIGVAVGVGIGAILGAVIAKKNKVAAAAIAGAAGGLAGGLIGHAVDSRRCALSKIAVRHDLTYSAAPLEVKASDTGQAEQVGSSFTIVDTAKHTQFETGSAELTPEAKIYFGEIAEQYRTSTRVAEASSADEKAAAAQTKILLIGHTDDTGSSELNADLSERRARAVARLFSSHGISPDNVFYQGAGETLPIADNHTDEGRARNRRVEIVDLTGAKPDILQSYASSRVPLYRYYRASASQPEERALRLQSPKPVAKVARSTSASKMTKGSTSMKAQAIASDAGAQPGSTVKPTSSTNGAEERIASSDGIDFGWRATSPAMVGLKFATIAAPSSTFAFLSSAVADEAPVSKSCTNDRPRVSHVMKSVADDRAVPVRDHLQNLYGSSWGATVNGQYLALQDVSVLRNGSTAGSRPTLLVWKDYEKGSGLSGPAQVRLSPDVNAYAVKDGVLYRVFVNNAGVFDCADIIFSNGKATAGELVRHKSNQFFTVDYVPTIARS
ncbi:OmpA family protein [Paraburkholderia bannensis]|uniref:OmpA family protein n=1 Tax=Paraburkholderia bannensis TaxID=765414 RepID=UPI002AB62BB8|nr:OmpA family protein [Paraburkholderia bannensis]